MNYLILGFFLSILTFSANAQELNFQVTVNTPTLQTADPRIFETFEQAVQEFMNNTKWTNDVYEEEERIKGSIVINVSKELSPTRFIAEVAIQSTRPIYESGEETVMFNFQDKNVWFDYEQYQPLIFNQNTFNDNLTATLAFYAYMMIGLDYDSFSPMGGESYFKIGQEIVTNIPPAISAAVTEAAGWRAQDGKINRFWLAENMLSPRTRNYRQAMYDYHRQGLDLMAEDAVAARAVINQALQSLLDVQRSYPNAMVLQTFSDAKSAEITEIFGNAPMAEKNKVIQVMTRIDGARSAKYRAIR
jgi:hypothetical protein